LKLLTDKTLLTYDRLHKGYNITAKGLKFIELENKMANLLRMPTRRSFHL